MKTYRKSFIVVVMYALCGLVVSGVVFAISFTALVSREDDLSLLYLAGGIIAMGFLIYLIYQVSISVRVDQERIVIKRFFRIRYEGLIEETALRAHFTTSSRLWKPTEVLLFVEKEDGSKSIRIVANGLGQSRTTRLLEETFGHPEVGVTNTLQTTLPKVARSLPTRK